MAKYLKDVIGRDDNIIIFNSNKFEYHTFNNYSDVLEYINKFTDTDRQFHEVIIGDRKQKIKFDMESETQRIDIQSMIDNIKQLFYVIYEITLDDNDIIITDQCRNNKYSYHIIIDNYHVNIF